MTLQVQSSPRHSWEGTPVLFSHLWAHEAENSVPQEPKTTPLSFVLSRLHDLTQAPLLLWLSVAPKQTLTARLTWPGEVDVS